ncbi:hypothetical protein LOTGIDRAFT_154286 [Lottia gigantea]|uniref:Nephrocystin 3-like N-terminal domain-containing protein n=1 Tax=Lottia gigantea TaxID=225164 RepID=V4A7C2_LOTGI|nr:hypothetical protein LOTGIDRAFT_154286 [Lottia gigantea]ESO89196.1 hypothetical protein LOTGIDRAFT_154286 [Lottia gigantea]
MSSGQNTDDEFFTKLEIYDKLRKCWNVIDSQCYNDTKNEKKEKKKLKPVKAGGWRTVRIFVSSTFTDFYNEREILVKQVFPELREWCESRRIQLIDCDLRWGVPKDTTTGETIAICLEELDLCHETNEGEPFFLNMTCDRYGWIPSDTDIPDDVKEKYNWIHNTSITFMEIMHGALRILGAYKNDISALRISEAYKNDILALRISEAYKNEISALRISEAYKNEISALRISGDYNIDKFIKFLIAAFVNYSNKGNDNAVFFVRNKDFIKDIPTDQQVKFKDTDTYSQEQLRLQKSKIRECFPHQVFDYSVKYNGLMDVMGKQMVSVTSLQTFASEVLDFFKTAISKKYPSPKQENISMEDIEKDLQWSFISEKAESMIGRECDIQTLIDVTKDKNNDVELRDKTDPNARNIEGWNIQEDDNKLFIVEGKSGWGKTSLLAKVTSILVNEDADIFYHFCGSTNLSRQEDNLMQRLIDFLQPSQSETPQESEKDRNDAGANSQDKTTDCHENGENNSKAESAEETNKKKPKELLQEAFRNVRNSKRKMILILDAVNELTSMDLREHLFWLFPSTPNNIRCIVSSNQHKPTLSRLAEYPTYWYTLQPMNESNLKELAINYLGNYKKKLDDEQLNLLIHNTGADNPQWVRLMCEELRVYGDFGSLTKKIEELPKTLDGLFSVIFSRLLTEDVTGCIKKTLCLIGVSYNGLPLVDILKILGDIVKNETIQAPPLHWAQARRHLKPYIRTVGYPHELLTFSHESIWKAVEKILLSNASEKAKWHVSLADYFQNTCENSTLRTQCIPFHLNRANLGKRLVKFLQSDVDATRIPDFTRSSYLQDFRCESMPSKTVKICTFCSYSYVDTKEDCLWNGVNSCIVCGIERLRCNSSASPQVPGTKEAKFCAFCSCKRGLFKATKFWQSKDCCIVCGAHAFGHQVYYGRMCSFHSTGAPNTSKCIVCNNIIFDKQSMNVSKGKLCNQCGFGNYSKTCCILNPRT